MSALHLVVHILTMMLIVHLRPTPLEMLWLIITIMNWLVSSHLSMMHILVSSHLRMVDRLITLHLIVMMTLMMLNSAHFA